MKLLHMYLLVQLVRYLQSYLECLLNLRARWLLRFLLRQRPQWVLLHQHCLELPEVQWLLRFLLRQRLPWVQLRYYRLLPRQRYPERLEAQLRQRLQWALRVQLRYYRLL